MFDSKTFNMVCILNPKLEVAVKSISIAQNNRDLVAAAYNKDNIFVFSIKQEKPIHTLTSETEPVFVDLNKEGTKMMVRDKDLYFFVVDVKEGTQSNKTKNVHTCQFSPFEVV